MNIVRMCVTFILMLLLSTLTYQVKAPKTYSYKDAYDSILSVIEKDVPYCARWRYIGTNGRRKIAARQSEVHTNVCNIYNLRLKPFVLHKEIESDHRYWVTNKSGAIGLGQIKEYWHGGRLYKILNGKLGRKLLKYKREGKEINHVKYFKMIGYNLHVSASLWRDWLDQNDQNYMLMLAAYISGPNSKDYLRLKKNPLLIYNKKNRVYNAIRYILDIDDL